MFKNENEIVKEMQKRYRIAAREVEKEINTLLDNYASKNGLSLADVKREVSATDIRDYEDKARKYVKDKNFSPKANREMSRYNLKMKISRLELLQSHIDLELIALADEMDKDMLDYLMKVGNDEVRRQAGILAESISIGFTAVEQIAKRKFHDFDFSSRIWRNKALLHRELKDRLIEQITKGQNPRKAARIMRETIEQSVYNTERIMRTESNRVQIEVQIDSFKQAGFEQYEYVTTEGACDICSPLDGKIFDIKDFRVGETAPPRHPMCRCSTAAHMDREEWDKKLKEKGL